MSRFRDELQSIPWVAWLIGGCLWIGIFLLMFLLPIQHDPELRQWLLPFKVLIAALPGLPLFAWAVLVGYVHQDARRRGMRYVMWTLLAAFIPNAIGIILYFVLRDPLLTPCPHCGTQVKRGFAFCPKCGGALTLACPRCHHAVEPGWTHCTNCGASLATGA